MNKYFFAFILIVFSFRESVAQDKEVESVLNKLMNGLREGQAVNISSDILYLPANVGYVSRELGPYFSDSLYTVRSKAYNILSIIGAKTENEQIRNQTVKTLLQGCRDRESSVSGNCSEALQQFLLRDYDQEAKDELGKLITPSTFYLNQIAQLAGFVNERSYEQLLLNLLSEPKISKRDKWATHLALARMGNGESLTKVLNRITSLPVNDDVIYEAGPALAYIRQKESIDYLFQIILSDRKDCESADNDSDVKILCAYRALEFVTPVIDNFPLKLDASGDLDIEDYHQALGTARSWYQMNKDSYLLDKENY